jgi:hypothetical protein
MMAARKLATDPASVPRGQMREVRRLGPGGHNVTEFIGARSFVQDLGRPCRRVSITNPIMLAEVAKGLIKI